MPKIVDGEQPVLNAHQNILSSTESVIHFDRELPLLRPPSKAIPWSRRDLAYSSLPFGIAPHCREREARRLAKLNYGRNQFELSKPVKSYLQLLEKLTTISGLVGISMNDRYSLTLKTGALFESPITAEKVAQCFQELFYPDEPLAFTFVSETDRPQDENTISRH